MRFTKYACALGLLLLGVSPSAAQQYPSPQFKEVKIGTAPTVGVLCNPNAGSLVFSACTTSQFAAMMNAYMPGWSTNVSGVGTPGLEGQWFIHQNPSSYTDKPALWVQRDVNSAGGLPGSTYKAIWASLNSFADDQGYNWSIIGEINNRTKGSTGAQNLAVNGTAWKRPNGGFEVGPTWGGNFLCDDTVGVANPVYSCIGAELASSVATATTDSNRQRVILQLVGGGASGAHIGRGIYMGGHTGVVVDRAFEISGLGSYQFGLDTTAATFSGPVVMMGDGQRIAFDGSSTGAYNRSLRYTAGSLVYQGANGNALSVNDDGRISAGYNGNGGVRLSLTNSAGTCTLTPTATTAAFACSSDERLKADIRDTRSAIDWLRHFRVRDYTINTTGEKATGVVAQEVQKTHPQMVHDGKDGMLAVDAPNPWMLIKAIQEQQSQIFWLRIWMLILTIGLVSVGYPAFKRPR